MKNLKIILIKNKEILEVRIDKYSADYARGEGFALEVRTRESYRETVGCVISSILAAIEGKNLSGKSSRLTEYEKVVLSVRAYCNRNFHPDDKNEILIITDNYNNLINRKGDISKVKDEIRRKLFVFFNSRPREYISGLSLYCSMYYDISIIRDSLSLLKEIGDIEPINRAGTWDTYSIDHWHEQYRLKPEIYKEMEAKFEQEKGHLQHYKVPEPERQARIKINGPLAAKKDPEPILDESEYENILKIIFNMAITMERSPKTFIKLEEEEIRNHFLSHLNGHYEGLATGETFNCEGKTDILIRRDGKNIFIAECKIWRGKKELLKAIDQLLSYTSWRDTKTAILIFNKNKNFSQVLSHIEPSVISHANYLNKRKLKEKILSNESVFAYNFCHKDDSQRELILSVMAFNIPQIG